jgi:membrane protease YdiL (CAAX protease family)
MTATVLLFVFVIGTLKLLYTLRGIPWIGQSLYPAAAVLLIYPAAFHVLKSRLPVRFFERNFPEIASSLKFFTLTALAIFPPFLLLAHLYQKVFFGTDFRLFRFFWSWSLMAFQVFVIALPEEFFFRGYLQTRLKQKFSKPLSLFGSSFFSVPTAVPITSLIFAASHSFIALQWWHFAIFFPSLVFGWLREKTNGLIASTLFHASCNILMVVVSRIYR